MKNEITDSVKDEFKKRLGSSLYGTYFIFWVLFHHEFIFAFLFSGEEKIWDTTKMLKSEFLSRTFFNVSSFSFWLSWIVPAILTWVFLKYFTKYISIPFYKMEQKFETEKRIIKIHEERKVRQEEIALEKENVEKLQITGMKIVKEKEVEAADPTVRWGEDYERFKKLVFAHKFSKIIESYYKRRASILETDQFGNEVVFEIPEDILAYAHSNEIVEIDRDLNKIEMTPKGKYFINKFLEDPNKPIEILF